MLNVVSVVLNRVMQVNFDIPQNIQNASNDNELLGYPFHYSVAKVNGVKVWFVAFYDRIEQLHGIVCESSMSWLMCGDHVEIV